MKAGPEAEFFLFQRRDGKPTTETHDAAGYFDLAPVDLGEDVRREIVLALEQMGFHVEAAHHEVAPGQHEIDFRYDDVLAHGRQRQHVPLRREERGAQQRPARDLHAQADLRRRTARACTRTSRSSAATANAFFDADGQWQLSETCLHYIGGLLEHAQGLLRDHQPAGEFLQAAGARATRRRPRSPGRRRTAARSCACRRRAAWARASSCACPIRPAIRTSRWR